MNERLKNWLLGILATISVTAGGSAIKAYFDVQYMKEQIAKGVSAERIAKLEGDLNAHEARAQAARERFEAEIADLKEGQRALWRARGGRDDR
jgi:hypothetical protein